MVTLSAGAESVMKEPYRSSVKAVAGTRNCLNFLLAERCQVLTPAL
jgi:hypothetical protein